jgi:hypothetical protein
MDKKWDVQKHIPPIFEVGRAEAHPSDLSPANLALGQ